MTHPAMPASSPAHWTPDQLGIKDHSQYRVSLVCLSRMIRTVRLNQLPLRTAGVIDHVEALSPTDAIAQRLGELGFVPGEPVKVIAFGPLGGDPMAVEIGFTRFALRQSEAQRIVLQAEAPVLPHAACSAHPHEHTPVGADASPSASQPASSHPPSVAEPLV